MLTSPFSPSLLEGDPSEKKLTPPLASIVKILLLRLSVIPVPSFILRRTPSTSPSPSKSANAGGDVIYPM